MSGSGGGRGWEDFSSLCHLPVTLLSHLTFRHMLSERLGKR